MFALIEVFRRRGPQVFTSMLFRRETEGQEDIAPVLQPKKFEKDHKAAWKEEE